LKNAGINSKEIKAIVITHCHWDHIGCAKKDKRYDRCKGNSPEIRERHLDKREIDYATKCNTMGENNSCFPEGLEQKISIEPSEVDIVIGEEDYSLEKFGIKGKIIFTPGHSPGSISVVLDSGEAFIGDMAMNGLPMTIGPNLPIFAEDMPALKNSWRKLVNKGAKKIYPAHGKPFPVEKLTGN